MREVGLACERTALEEAAGENREEDLDLVGQRGRPKLCENARLGHRRICRELAKIGLQVSPTRIRRLLAHARLEPAPRRAGPSWGEFLRAQAASIVACDFFTVEGVFLRRYYALFFIAHGNRRVWLVGCTFNPNSAWVTQQARNLGLTSPTKAFVS